MPPTIVNGKIEKEFTLCTYLFVIFEIKNKNKISVLKNITVDCYLFYPVFQSFVKTRLAFAQVICLDLGKKNDPQTCYLDILVIVI